MEMQDWVNRSGGFVKVGQYNPATGYIQGSGAVEPNYFFEGLAVGGPVTKAGLRGVAAIRGAAAKGGGCVFWSGGDDAMNAGMNYAKANGTTTLEMTRAG